MWEAQLPTPRSVEMQFEDWLEERCGQSPLSAVVQNAIEDPEEPNLLDIVAAWVSYEDTILGLPSYSAFMSGLILIIDDWVEGDKKRINGTPLARDATTGIVYEVKHLIPATAHVPEGDDSEMYVGIPHELFNASAFEAQRVKAQQHQMQVIQEALAGLAPRARKHRK